MSEQTKTLEQQLTENFFFTLPYYCNAPEAYMREQIRKAVHKWLNQFTEFDSMAEAVYVTSFIGRLQKELDVVQFIVKEGNKE
jgi:hypothetical protein